MNVLLAGGAGFLAKNFASLWRHRHPGSQLVVVDTLRRHRRDVPVIESLGDVTVVEADIDDVDLVSRLLDATGIDVVVNFASEARVERAAADPQAAVRSNMASVVSLLEAAQRRPSLRFHQVSSAEVFGASQMPAVNEDAPYAPRNAYGATKAGADHLVRAYRDTYGIDTTISIAPNVYGPFQQPDQAVARFITHAILGIPLPVFGRGHVVREWLHVTDHSRGVAAVIEHGVAGMTYNLGSGETRTVGRLAETVLALVGRPMTMIHRLPDRPGHASRPVLDASRAQRELGWRPWTTLEEGLRRTVEWYGANRSWWEDHPALGGPASGMGRPGDRIAELR